MISSKLIRILALTIVLAGCEKEDLKSASGKSEDSNAETAALNRSEHSNADSNADQGRSCTEEAKLICTEKSPGVYTRIGVGRSGANCEFPKYDNEVAMIKCSEMNPASSGLRYIASSPCTTCGTRSAIREANSNDAEAHGAALCKDLGIVAGGPCDTDGFGCMTGILPVNFSTGGAPSQPPKDVGVYLFCRKESEIAECPIATCDG